MLIGSNHFQCPRSWRGYSPARRLSVYNIKGSSPNGNRVARRPQAAPQCHKGRQIRRQAIDDAAIRSLIGAMPRRPLLERRGEKAIWVAMTPTRSMMAVLAILALVGAGAARAEPMKPSAGVTADGFAARSINGVAPKSSLEWDARRGRWGLKLDMEQHVVGDMQWRDVRPGVFYRVTPRLHIGGAVSLSSDQLDLNRLDPQPPAPRVRLETTFKF